MNLPGPVLPVASTRDFASGAMVPHAEVVVRRLSQMPRAFAGSEAVATLLERGEDPVIYRAFPAAVPEQPGHLARLRVKHVRTELGS